MRSSDGKNEVEFPRGRVSLGFAVEWRLDGGRVLVFFFTDGANRGGIVSLRSSMEASSPVSSCGRVTRCTRGQVPSLGWRGNGDLVGWLSDLLSLFAFRCRVWRLRWLVE